MTEKNEVLCKPAVGNNAVLDQYFLALGIFFSLLPGLFYVLTFLVPPTDICFFVPLQTLTIHQLPNRKRMKCWDSAGTVDAFNSISAENPNSVPKASIA